MSSDVNSEKLLDWIALSKKLKMTNENIVNNLQVMLINIKFETDERMQKISEGVQTTAQTCPEPTEKLLKKPKQQKAPKQKQKHHNSLLNSNLVLCLIYNLQF